MPVFNVPDPQHARQNDDIAKRISQIVLRHHGDKRDKGQQADRHDVAPERKPGFAFAKQHKPEEDDQQQLKEFRRLKALVNDRDRQPSLGVVIRIPDEHNDDQQPEAEQIEIRRIFDEQPIVENGDAKKYDKPQRIIRQHAKVVAVILGMRRGAVQHRDTDDHEQQQDQDDGVIDFFQFAQHEHPLFFI
ncbi:hypothetical protein D3C81_1304390 [compost metagenome]